MSAINARVVTRATAVAADAYRNGRLGDIVVSEAHDYIGFVTDPAAAPTPIDLTAFVPSNDNLTDLGDAAHRFRSLYLGTSILNVGDLNIELSGGTTRTLTVFNPTVGQVAAIETDGGYVITAGIQITAASIAGPNGVARINVSNTGLGFYDSVPVSQPAPEANVPAIAAIVGADTVNAAAVLTQLQALTDTQNSLLAKLRALGVIDT